MARINYSQPTTTQPASVAGGIGEIGDIISASWRQVRLVENTNASTAALEEAYDTLRRDIRQQSGLEPPPNPLSPDAAALDDLTRQAIIRGEMPSSVLFSDQLVETQRRDFQRWMNDQAGQLPAEAVKGWSGRDPVQDARRLAREADEDLGRLMDSRPGWDKYAAAFVGGAGGSLYDPLTVGTLFLGGGAGAAKTVGGRILTTVFREALLNAGVEAAVQPIVQDWRKQAGLPHGFDEAARNVVMAATVGGVIGGGGRAIAETLTALARRGGKLSPKFDAALDGDQVAQRELLEEIRAELPDEARGALDAIEANDAAWQSAPGRRAEILQSRALLHAQNPALARDMAEPLPIDHDQVARIVKTFEPAGAAATAEASVQPAAAGRPMTAFVKAIGGVEPGSPLALELNARGIDSRSAPGLFRREGRTDLDNVPLDEVPGDLRANMRSEQGTVYARQQEFIDALEAEARPDRQQGGRGIDDETEAFLLDVDAKVQRVLQERPGSDDAFVREAVTLMNDEGLELDAAIGRIEARTSGTPEKLPDLPADRPLTAEDLTDLEARVSAADVDEAIDFKALEEAGFAGDVRVPWGDDTISIESLQRELEDTEWLEHVVMACKVA